MSYFSVKQQKDLFRRLGLNPKEYDPNNDEIVNKFFAAAINAQLSGFDANGRSLNSEDFELLYAITGRR